MADVASEEIVVLLLAHQPHRRAHLHVDLVQPPTADLVHEALGVVIAPLGRGQLEELVDRLHLHQLEQLVEDAQRRDPRPVVLLQSVEQDLLHLAR